MSAARRPGFRLSARGRRQLHLVARLAALVGILLGLNTLVIHLFMDPLNDLRVYYDAGTRLNDGLPLYDVAASDSFGLYLNPPLLAIAFRPLALLPFEVAAAAWMTVLALALVLTLRRIGMRGPVLLALCLLAEPLAWTFTIGQAEPVLTLLLAIGAPWSVAAAGWLKLFPWLAAGYWLVRRDWRALRTFTLVVALLGVGQAALEPRGTLAFLQLTWLRPAFEVRNISPFAVHPLLWVVLLGVLVALLVRYGRTRWGWPLAVALAVLAYPRLLVYQLMSLLAAFGGPDELEEGSTGPAAG